MKTNYVDMQKRYELAERHVWSKLPNWQKEAIQADRIAGKDTGILDKFTQDIIHLAENINMPLNDVHSPVPEVTHSNEIIQK